MSLRDTFTDLIRTNIGSFYPTSITMTDEDMYRQILELDPQFSLYGLYLRYARLHEDIRMDYIDMDLYNSVKDLEYDVSDNMEGVIDIRTSNIEEFKSVLGDGVEYGDNTITITINDYPSYHELRNVLLVIGRKISLDPEVIHPCYVRSDGIIFIYTKKPKGDGYNFVKKYLDWIKELEPDFSLFKYYHTLNRQHKVAKKLDIKYKKLLDDNIIDYIFYSSENDNITIYRKNGDRININDSIVTFKQMVAYLYSGMNYQDVINLTNIGYDTYQFTW